MPWGQSPKSGCFFGRMLPEYSRLTKTMQFILMKLYTRKIGIWTNDWSYWIYAICSNFLLKRKESKRVTGVRGEYLRDSEIIEEVLYRARKTLERNLWSQVSRRDNFTLLIMANILSELGQMWVCCWILNRIILICSFHGLKMLLFVRIQVAKLTCFYLFSIISSFELYRKG